MRFFSKPNSITTRLLLLGVLILLLGAAARIFLLKDFLRQDVTDLASGQLVTIANYVAQDIDRDITQRRELLERIANQFPHELLNNPPALQAWLGVRHEVNPLFSSGMFVLDTAGTIVADYPAMSNRIGTTSRDRDYFIQAMKGEFAIGRPVMGRTVKMPILPMAMPLRDKNGKIRAVLVGISALRSGNFLGSLYTSRVGVTGGLSVISPRDKLFIGSSDMDNALDPTPPEGVHPQHDQVMKGFRGVGVDVRKGIEELAAITSVPSSGWVVVARMPTREVYAPLTSLQNFIVNCTFFLVPFFFLVAIGGLRYLLRPLIVAAQHADQMMRGDIPLAPLPVTRNDEVGHLTTAFNRILSKLLASRVELEHFAHHDMLTGLPNRQLLADRMKQALARAQRRNGKVVLLFLDLDGFKSVNDRLGHEAGDIALRQVAERLQSVVRQEDTLARVGGDEFVILLSDLNDNFIEAAELVAKKCLEVFERAFIIRDQSCLFGVSIGIALGDGNCSANKLLVAADQAMYRAKQAGRGRFLWSEECASCAERDQNLPCPILFSREHMEIGSTNKIASDRTFM